MNYERKFISELSKESGINRTTIVNRLKNGWSLEDAISIKPTNGGSSVKTKYVVDGKIFADRFGNEFIVNGVSYRDKNSVIHYNIRFIKSGYETIATSSQIRGIGNKHVQDRLSPSVFKVGILGYAYAKDNKKLFDVWRAMIARCYNSKNPSYKTYGAMGIAVCDRWKRFDYFLEDVKNLPGYDENKINNGKLVLDKDLINRSLKIYSQETCCFVSRSENTRESANRRWNEKKCRD